MLRRNESAHTVLVLLHNPTARCHDVAKQPVEKKKKTVLQTECSRAKSCQQVIRSVWEACLWRAIVIGDQCENYMFGQLLLLQVQGSIRTTVRNAVGAC